MKWQSLSAEVKVKEDNIGRLQVEQEAKIADQRRVDAEVEQKRDELVNLNDEVNEVQKRYYDYGTEIARIEDSIRYQNERNQQLSMDLEEVSENWYKIRADIDSDQRKLGELKHELAQTEPQQNQVQQVQSESMQQLAAAEEAMQQWQANWDEFNRLAAESQNKGRFSSRELKVLSNLLNDLMPVLAHCEMLTSSGYQVRPLKPKFPLSRPCLKPSKSKRSELRLNSVT